MSELLCITSSATTEAAAETEARRRLRNAGLFGGHLLLRKDRLHAEIIEALMCRGMVDLADCCTRHEADLKPLVHLAKKAVEQMPDAAKLVGTKIVVSSPLFTRLVTSRFDPDLEGQTDKFSKAS